MSASRLRTTGATRSAARLLVLFCGGLATLALAACNESNSYVPPPPPRVTVAQPLAEATTRYLEFTGNTDAINDVDLEARVQGSLDEIKYKDGSLVKKDTLLFVIQRNVYEAQLEQAKASLASAQAKVLNAQAEYTRQSTLGKSDFASQAHVMDAKANLDEATAEVTNAQANVAIATINLGYTEVSAPFDGIVTRHLVDVGALVGYSGPTKLATIIQVDPIYVYFNASETVVLRIKEALTKRGKTFADVQAVEVEVGLQTEDGYPHKGHIDYIAPNVDASTGTLQVRAVFDNKDVGMLPGLFVRVRVPVQKVESSLLVSDAAIGTNQLGEYLLVLGKDNVVEQRQITVGQLDGGLRVIESGLKPDDWVITEGIQSAIPGNTVAPQKVTMTASAEG